jgi:hypothetical protein
MQVYTQRQKVIKINFIYAYTFSTQSAYTNSSLCKIDENVFNIWFCRELFVNQKLLFLIGIKM